LNYGDFGQAPQQRGQIEGIVLIDEIDAHLHADLQHDVLPALLKMFPRVQFIVTSHSPLFPLGMHKTFGEDGFSLIELPSGVTISPERFSEFSSSFAYFQATKTFETDIRGRIIASQRPLVLCEGETDPLYLKTAAELLGYLTLVNGADFEWVGSKTASGQSEGGGASNLNNALKFLKNNPQFLNRRLVLLYDCDTQKVEESPRSGLFVRTLKKNYENNMTDKGIENLLPDNVFEEKFFFTREVRDGLKRTVIKDIKKIDLCNHLCFAVRQPLHFVEFKDILSELAKILALEEPLSSSGLVGQVSATICEARTASDAD
jgi:predicted ATP-dependent endonuclease of OLD family